MESRQQRCALPTSGDIAAAEVSHRGDASVLGNPAGVAQLHGERYFRRWSVAYGLPVRADGRDLRRADLGLFQQGIGR